MREKFYEVVDYNAVLNFIDYYEDQGEEVDHKQIKQYLRRLTHDRFDNSNVKCVNFFLENCIEDNADKGEYEYLVVMDETKKIEVWMYMFYLLNEGRI